MLYDRKLVKEVNSLTDWDLSSTEYKISVYDEISSYLADNNCSQGVNLVNKAKQEMNNYVKDIKQDLVEIENIYAEMSKLIKNLNDEKNNIPSMMTINNKEIFISHFEGKYGFIYLIGFDKFKKLYKYGIIEANINKGKFYKLNSKIGLSYDGNLVRYADFKNYFNDLIKEFNNAKSIEDLDFLNKCINNELSELFNTKDLREYLAYNSEHLNKLTGISGFYIMRTLYQSYDINRVKIKLILNGYSIENDKFIELVRNELSFRKTLDYLNNSNATEDEEIKNIYNKSLKKESKRVEVLMKELNISSAELEIAVNKVDSEL